MKAALLPTSSRYAEHGNSQWVRLLDLLDMSMRYKWCLGAELWTEDGDRYLDFLSGYCVHNAGHNHPRIIEALKEELFGQMLVMRFFQREKILTQICGNNFMVSKSAPPLVVSEEQLKEFVAAAGQVVSDVHESTTFWTDALALGRRALDI